MSRSLDAATLAGLDSLTGLGLPAARSEATLAAFTAAMVTLAPLDEVALGETPPAAAFSATWE